MGQSGNDNLVEVGRHHSRREEGRHEGEVWWVDVKPELEKKNANE